ncbi:hypothetical protein XM53_00965 [Roseovarius atlanticus]|uniref:Uncharacterized protein n=1 Tax=Roseovarius atlanticus TaxID=1641875 RepID=A0A0T5P040_9RHOB|nr:hypothetical protein XM53_00965 [Roseovarius atlanticus]
MNALRTLQLCILCTETLNHCFQVLDIIFEVIDLFDLVIEITFRFECACFPSILEVICICCKAVTCTIHHGARLHLRLTSGSCLKAEIEY